MPSGGNSLCRCWDFLLSLLPDIPLGSPLGHPCRWQEHPTHSQRSPSRSTAGFCGKTLGMSLIPSLLRARTALELSTWPTLLPTCQLIRPARPQPAAELRMLGRCHSPCPSPAAFVFQPIGVKTCRDIRVILFPCEKRWPGRRRSPKLLPQHGKAAGTVQPRCEPPEEPRKTGFITRLFLKLLLQLCALFNC